MSTETNTDIRIHRYGDKIAVDLDQTETIYFSRLQIQELSAVLETITKDINDFGFVDSQFPIVTITPTGEIKNDRQFTTSRLSSG